MGNNEEKNEIGLEKGNKIFAKIVLALFIVRIIINSNIILYDSIAS
ncbi:MAG TPA: hypothetical protein VD815_11825 [Candidatus Saccharimonadales bacterium]|nr:hypothetical protein [Candidatus Saccharimonadales bacterium]